MNASRLPLLIEPEQLASIKDDSNIVVVDLCKESIYNQSHIPGAIHIEYAQIVASKKPVMGLVPDEQHLSSIMSQAGIQNNDTVIAYDDEGGGKAARFLYTLDIIGHKNFALLNGGLHAWANEAYPLESTPNKKTPSNYHLNIDPTPIATKDFIQNKIGNGDIQVIDARSNAEYEGSKKFAEKGGHIPGAVNLDWVNLMDQHNNLRLKSNEEINQMLHNLNIKTDKPTVVYCQTHHRSALTYIALKNLGFADVKGYPGSWSEWGNSPETPVETGEH